MNGQCVLFPIRAQLAKPGELVEVLGAQVLTWLPPGFGLVLGWKVSDETNPFGGSNGAVWTDQTCRQVMLEVFPGAARDESPMPDGRWLLTDRSTCTFGSVRDVNCLTYHAQTNGAAVSLMLVDLTQQEADRVVAGIRV